MQYIVNICLSTLLATLLALSGCAGSKTAAKPRQEAKEPKLVEKKIHRDQPLQQAYPLVVVEPVAISADMAHRYPTVASNCQHQAIKRLRREKRRFTVTRQLAPADKGKPALLVQSRITDIRLPSRTGGPGNARPESAHICLTVQLVDAQSGEVLQERQLSTLADQSKTVAPPHNAGVATPDASDASKALGDIIARYLLAVMPLH